MTPKQIAAAAMSGVRELSYQGMIVIDKGDLLEIIREAAETARKEGYEEGHEHGVGLGRKLGSIEVAEIYQKKRPAKRRPVDLPDESYDI